MNEREIVVTPEQYAKLEAELRKFEGDKFRREYQAEWVKPQLVVASEDWARKPVERLDAAKLCDMYPAPNRKQRRAMRSVARRMR